MTDDLARVLKTRSRYAADDGQAASAGWWGIRDTEQGDRVVGLFLDRAMRDEYLEYLRTSPVPALPPK